MSHERLAHLCDMLEASATLPPATHAWLRDCLRRWQAGDNLQMAFGITAVNAKAERNAIIRRHQAELPTWSTSGRARILATEAKRIHRGRSTAFPWIARVDRLAPLPETARMFHHILK